MSKANSKLANAIGGKKPQEKLVAAKGIPKPDATNIQGSAAYSQDKWLKLLTMLNTLKLQPQYYRDEKDTLKELQGLVEICSAEDPYLTCQCIVYSRCLGEGMRTISHAASVFIAPHISGTEYSKRFYSLWNKKAQKGGVIYRPDDMSEIVAGFVALNGEYKTTTTTVAQHQSVATEVTVDITGVKLTNAMKKGFKNSLETLDSYSLLKYKSKLIDVINLVHPSSVVSKAEVDYGVGRVKTLDAIMRGYTGVSADTWEVNQGNAGQIVAKAVREGKLDEEEAKEILTEAKADNWKELLENNKLGILAGIRNLRNILLSKPTLPTVKLLCDLVSDPILIRQGKIMPYQLDLANDVMRNEFNSMEARQITQALAKGYIEAVPNLAAMLPGRNLVIHDKSGSMGQGVILSVGNKNIGVRCSDKSALIAATIAKATNCDIIEFGSAARTLSYDSNLDIFSLAKDFNQTNMGLTDLSKAWELAENSGIKYDRVFILSDNEVNRGSTYERYASYVRKSGQPYVYSVDLAGYGSNAIAGDKVRYYFGYGFAMFEDIASSEFNAEYHLDKVKKVII